jgi:hypothetical protein
LREGERVGETKKRKLLLVVWKLRRRRITCFRFFCFGSLDYSNDDLGFKGFFKKKQRSLLDLSFLWDLTIKLN